MECRPSCCPSAPCWGERCHVLTFAQRQISGDSGVGTSSERTGNIWRSPRGSAIKNAKRQLLLLQRSRKLRPLSTFYDTTEWFNHQAEDLTLHKWPYDTVSQRAQYRCYYKGSINGVRYNLCNALFLAPESVTLTTAARIHSGNFRRNDAR